MLRIAVIGAGAIGRIHARNVAAQSDAALAAVCDKNLDAANRLATDFGSLAVGSAEDALSGGLDGAIIASSTASHGDVAMACVAAGVPFLCEKPLASDQATARQIVNTARSTGLLAATAFNRRFDAGYAGIKAAVSSGEIGRVEAVLMTSRTASPPSVEFTRTSGGLFGEKGAHFYDLARWITEEHPVEVFAMGSALVNPAFAETGEGDTAMITMRMPSGALCQFTRLKSLCVRAIESTKWKAVIGIRFLRISVGPDSGCRDDNLIVNLLEKNKCFQARNGVSNRRFPNRCERELIVKVPCARTTVETTKPQTNI